jgi:protein O-GlcNAc transferase
LTLENQNLQRILDDALQHHQNRRFSEAEQIYQRILAINPRHPDCLHLLGMIAYQAGSLETAADMIREAIVLNSSGTSYYANLGTVLQAQGMEEAEILYRQVLTLKPDLAEVHVNLGNVLQALGELSSSVACYERALALKPACAETHNNLGNARQKQGLIDGAISCYERALSIGPDYAEAYYNLGNACRDQDKLDEAVTRYQEVLTIEPSYAEAYYNLGNVLREQANWRTHWRSTEELLYSDQITRKPVSVRLWPNCFKGTSRQAGITLNDVGNLQITTPRSGPIRNRPRRVKSCHPEVCCFGHF